MKYFLLSIFVLSLNGMMSSCKDQPKQEQPLRLDEALKEELSLDLPDSLSARRIAFVLALKKKVAERSWKGFGDKEVEGTFIYFNGDYSEVFFPSVRVLKTLDSHTSFSEDYLLTSRTDSIPYHFELMISLDPADSSKFYYDHPVQQFLSVEEIGQFIPSVTSTEQWATMVIHEMFHHYQYNQKPLMEYAKNEIGSLPYDTRNLNTLFREDTLFRKGIQQENALLEKAITTQDPHDRRPIIQTYLDQRAERMAQYGKGHTHLEKVENYYVIQEGTARYMEYQSMKVMESLAGETPPLTIENDPMFKQFEEFKEVDLTLEAFNYLPYATATTYYYALGFNTLRLLDVLGIPYQDSLLQHPEKSLHTYLSEYLNDQ